MGELAVTGEEDPTIVDGERVGTRPGLALLPGVVVGTQFVRRQRYNRMLGLLLKYPDHFVIGVGSGTALVLRNGCEEEIIGEVTAGKPGRVELVVARPGNKFDCAFIGGR